MSDAPEPADAAVDGAAGAEGAEREARQVDALGSAAAASVREPDEVLLDSVEVARRSLLEVTPPETVGSVIGHIAEGEHVLSLHFAADLAGYPGWHWSVTLARVDEGEPTVLETELLPGERALLAPEWVPWSERLAEYRSAQAAAAAEAAAQGDGEAQAEGSEEADDEAFPDDTDDADGDDVFDGIDIDALDDGEDEDDDDEDDDDSDGEDEDDDDSDGEDEDDDDADDDDPDED
ncbi:DUF3027 domain-containing protein [Agromyces sp. ZXT2-6]|uniref:DUF3027 domain-containing protein n=1 Tax=Agromyces sp. ZXT2-6 TaxID=3461153 RepID=UPI0040553231